MNDPNDNKYHIPKSAFLRDDGPGRAVFAVKNYSGFILPAIILFICFAVYFLFDADYEFRYFQKRSFNRKVAFQQKKKRDTEKEKQINATIKSRSINCAGYFSNGQQGTLFKVITEYFNADGTIKERINYGIGETDKNGTVIRYDETRTVFSYSTDGTLQSSRSESTGGGPNETINYKCDRDGNILEKSTEKYSFIGTVKKIIVVEKYNDRGEIFEKISENNKELTTEQTKDKNGRVVKEAVFETYGSAAPRKTQTKEYSYFANGNIDTVRSALLIDGKILNYDDSIYDDQGYLIKWRQSSDGWFGGSTYKKFYYDENGNITESRSRAISSSASEKYYYDARNNLVSKAIENFVEVRSGSGKSAHTKNVTVYSAVEKYSYDKDGLITQKIETENGKPKRIFKYEYEKR